MPTGNPRGYRKRSHDRIKHEKNRRRSAWRPNAQNRKLFCETANQWRSFRILTNTKKCWNDWKTSKM
ncbi:L28 family ribosomal protein [Laspinema palackyanum]|uniref:L28 family ribosomal protein n=1 Tax=Laspinema palackyanum TaxID=3231601 RepID=UPI003F53F9AC